MSAVPRTPLPPGLPIIELDDVHLSFGTTPVLDGVSLTVRCGERLAVIGPSGAGKSTLIRCMNGLAVPQSGTVRLLGADLRAPGALRAARLRCDMIFQSFNLYAQRTVLDNVSLAPRVLLRLPRAAAEAEARRQLDAMEIGHLADRYPFQLSGGQQQRVALARALAKAPDILLLDEPTSALDPERVAGVLQVIERATAKGITTVTVTHELGFARRQASRLIFMEAGVIVEEGPPERCLKAPRTTRLRSFLSRWPGRPAPAGVPEHAAEPAADAAPGGAAATGGARPPAPRP